jgi:hypothetical protein
MKTVTNFKIVRSIFFVAMLIVTFLMVAGEAMAEGVKSF